MCGQKFGQQHQGRCSVSAGCSDSDAAELRNSWPDIQPTAVNGLKKMFCWPVVYCRQCCTHLGGDRARRETRRAGGKDRADEARCRDVRLVRPTAQEQVPRQEMVSVLIVCPTSWRHHFASLPVSTSSIGQKDGRLEIVCHRLTSTQRFLLDVRHSRRCTSYSLSFLVGFMKKSENRQRSHIRISAVVAAYFFAVVLIKISTRSFCCLYGCMFLPFPFTGCIM